METTSLIKKMPPAPTVLFDGARRYLTGVALLLSVVLLWTASNFITADLETGDDSWNKPFLITYVNTASFAFYLIPTAWRYFRGKPLQPVLNDYESQYVPVSQTPTHPPDSPKTSTSSPRASLQLLTSRRSTSLTRSVIPASPRTSMPLLESATLPVVHQTTLPKLTIKETAVLAFEWSAVWFIANYAVNASLGMTSVASVTILSSTSGFFTLALGCWVGVEKFNTTNGFAVIASFIGVLLVTGSDSTIASSTNASDLPPYPLLGDVAALLSAAFYAVYVILLKVKIVDEDRADMQLMLGFSGLFNIIFLLPAFPLLHFTGWETFELPPTRIAWIICLVNMSITLSSDYLYMLAMLKTSPMLVTIGLSLTIPLALLGSVVLPNASSDAITLLSLLGAGLVFIGFSMLGWQGWEESKLSDPSIGSQSQTIEADG